MRQMMMMMIIAQRPERRGEAVLPEDMTWCALMGFDGPR